MKLIEFNCTLTGNTTTNNWVVSKLALNTSVNLLVGQNATGKSRVVKYLNSFIDLISDNDSFEDNLDNYLKAELKGLFQNENGSRITYSVLVDLKKGTRIVEEILQMDEKVVLKRKNGVTEIFSFLNNKLSKISPPENRLVLHIRRDKEEYPFFEEIVQWAEQSVRFDFAGEDSGKNLYFWFEELNKQSVEILLKDFNTLGYRSNSIFIKKHRSLGKKIVHLQEDSLDKSIVESELSQGMSRALELLIFVQFLLQENDSSIFLLDDLGEGLDYERATKLGKLLVEKLESSNIQFIATSNDSFLMDVIPIKYWNILEREGNVVKGLNYQNSKEAFDNFKMSGLSNFHLFSSNFLHQTF